jgi:phage FluMu protein Com
MRGRMAGMFFHEIKCQTCGEVAKVRKLTPSPEMDVANLNPSDTDSLKLVLQIECPKCGVVSQTDTVRKN